MKVHDSIYRRFDSKLAVIVSECRCADGTRFYKVTMNGYAAIWLDSETLAREFSRKMITERKYRTFGLKVTA